MKKDSENVMVWEKVEILLIFFFAPKRLSPMCSFSYVCVQKIKYSQIYTKWGKFDTPFQIRWHKIEFVVVGEYFLGYENIKCKPRVNAKDIR